MGYFEMKHITDEQYREHELVFMQATNGLYSVDIRSDNYDGEFIGAYQDCLSITDARNKAVGFIDGWKARKWQWLKEDGTLITEGI